MAVNIQFGASRAAALLAAAMAMVAAVAVLTTSDKACPEQDTRSPATAAEVVRNNIGNFISDARTRSYLLREPTFSQYAPLPPRETPQSGWRIWQTSEPGRQPTTFHVEYALENLVAPDGFEVHCEIACGRLREDCRTMGISYLTRLAQ